MDLVQAELDDVKRIKKEREDMLLTCKRQLAEAQQEAQKYGMQYVNINMHNLRCCLHVVVALG